MSLTKRTWSDFLKAHYFTATGSVTGATTKLTLVFQADSWIYGVKGTINVYVDGAKKSCSWTTNTTETVTGTTYKTKMTSAQITVAKPFFELKLTDSEGERTLSNTTFSFYEIEKAPTGATTSGGVMDGSTKSKVVFTTSVTDATYTATFSLGSKTGIATSSSKTLEYAIPLSWCTELPNKTTATANVACQVLFGGQVYSTFNTTLIVSVPASVVPTVSAITLSDKEDTPVPASWNMYIQHKSGVRLSAVTCAGAQGSTINTIRLQVGSQSVSDTYSASALPQINTITQSGSLTATVTVTDSRGRTGSMSATVTFVPYSAPKFKKCVSERSNSAGVSDNDGTYFLSTTTVEYSSCSGMNSITMTVQYKKTNAAIYSAPVTIIPGTNVCGGDLNTEYSYDVLYTITDQFSSVSYTDYVSTAVYLMHFLHGGKGVAFGQKATIAECVDFNFQALFRKIATFLGKAVFRSADIDRVVINDSTKASPLMVDPNGAGTLYAVATSKDIGAAACKAVANNLTTTDEGSVLDARQGKTLNDGKVNRSGDTMTGNLTVDRTAASGVAASVKAIGNAGAVALFSNTTNQSGVFAADESKWIVQYDKSTGTTLVPYLGISSSANGTVAASFDDATFKNLYLKKIGKLVFMTMIFGYNNATKTIPTNTSLFTIPTAYRPKAEATIGANYAKKASSSSLNTISAGLVKISAAGVVTQAHSSSAYMIFAFGMWETA